MTATRPTPPPANDDAPAGRPLPGTLLVAASLAFAVYMTWGVIDYSGLYRWLAEWQISAFGGHLWGLTAMAPVMLVTCPLFAIGVAIMGDGKGGAIGCFSLMALVALGTLALGVGLMMRAAKLPAPDDPLQTLDLATARGAPPVAAHVRLIGRADRARALAIRWKGKTTVHEDVYTPIVAPSGGPVRFVAKHSAIDPQGPPQAAGDDPQGILWPAALPNEARAGMARAGTVLAPEVHLLDISYYDPLFDWLLAGFCTAVGAVGTALTAVLAWRGKRPRVF